MTNKKQQIRADVPPNLEPVFANAIDIRFKDDEFAFTFLHKAPILPSHKVRAIVAMTPQYAKRFHTALDETIKMFEKQYGEIKLPEKPEEPKGVEVA